jgi:hypothetical protein
MATLPSGSPSSSNEATRAAAFFVQALFAAWEHPAGPIERIVFSTPMAQLSFCTRRRTASSFLL